MDMSTCLIFTLICIMLFYFYAKRPYKLWPSLGVRGPEPKLLYGNVCEIYGPHGGKDGFSKWQSLYGRVYGVYYYREPALVVTEPEWIKQVCAEDFAHFHDHIAHQSTTFLHPELNDALFFARGDTWRRIRMLMSPSFSVAKIRDLTRAVNRCAEKLGEQLMIFAADGRPWEAKRHLEAFAMDVVMSSGFSVDADSPNNLGESFSRHGRGLFNVQARSKFLNLLVGSFPAIMYPVSKLLKMGAYFNEDMEFLEGTIKRMISDRRKGASAHNNDVLQNLLEAENGVIAESGVSTKLRMEEIVAQGVMLFVAGYETTSSALQFLLYELANHRDVAERITAEIDDIIGSREPTYDLCLNLKYAEAAINETLRMYPPVPVLSRECSRPTKLFHLHLPPKTAVVIPLYNLHRDPEFWKNPNDFNPDRFVEGSPSYRAHNPYTFLPFGAGPRQCLGMTLALLEMKLTLVHIFNRLTVVKATPEVLKLNDFNSVLQACTPIKIYTTVRYSQKTKKRDSTKQNFLVSH